MSGPSDRDPLLPQPSVAEKKTTAMDDRIPVRSRDDETSGESSAQAGVRRLEAISSTWSKWGLIMAYAGLYTMAFAISLETQTTTNLTVYATSNFKAHSLVATVAVIQSIMLSVVKPPMSKIADVFGRLEAFGISIVLCTIGFIQQAAANSVRTYAAAQVFYSSGSTGLQILQQIFIADTSTLVNRALFSTIPDIPYLLNVWIGAPLADGLLTNLGWRWGYGIWAVILPVSFLPLALALYVNQRKAAKRGLLPPSAIAGKGIVTVVENLWYELDVFGLVLLCVAVSLVLIPLTTAGHGDGNWGDRRMVTMMLIGVLCLIAFPFWERNKRLAPRAFLSLRMFKNKTVRAGVGIAFFYFMAFYLSVFPYFFSYLLVVHDKSVVAAGRITQTFTFTSTVTALIASFIIRHVKRYRSLVRAGAGIYILGLILILIYRSQGVSTSTLVICQVVLGIGGSLIHVPAQIGVQASASHQEVAAVTAIFLTLLEIGGAVGSAISGAIWTANIPGKLAKYLPLEDQDQAEAIFGNITLASRGWPMGSPTRIAINQAYQETMTKILMVAVVVSLPLIPLSLMMKDYRLDELDQHVKGLVIGGTREWTASDETQPLTTAPDLADGSSDERSSERLESPRLRRCSNHAQRA